MIAAEKAAYAEGSQAKDFMENAGKNIASYVLKMLQDDSPEKTNRSFTIALLCGKGNNGGDAYVAGRYLLKSGLSVFSLDAFSEKECSPLNQINKKKFIACGGSEKKIESLKKFKNLILLDGLLGIGFRAPIDDHIKKIIQFVNNLKILTISIDIPSGLDANVGLQAPQTTVIKAHTTLYLGQPKLGFFLGNAWDFIGKLEKIDFGIEKKFIDSIPSSFSLVENKKFFKYLPKISRVQHKYSRGLVTVYAGQKGMFGAAKLTTEACLRTGAGIVKLFCSKEIYSNPSACIPEIVKLKVESKEDVPDNVLKQSKSLLLGPGLGQEKKTEEILRTILNQTQKPLVLDADGINLYAKSNYKLHENVLMTPHLGEMKRLLGEELKKSPHWIKQVLNYVKSKNISLILKGAPSFVFFKSGEIKVCPWGDPGMATAGSGDVLSGILAALLAQGLSVENTAILGVYIHSRAGEIAAKKLSSHCVIASDITNNISHVFQEILRQQ